MYIILAWCKYDLTVTVIMLLLLPLAVRGSYDKYNALHGLHVKFIIGIALRLGPFRAHLSITCHTII